MSYPRDLAGYGRVPPQVQWPDGARLALQFVLNFEEGAENCVLHGDPASETFLSEIVGAKAYEGVRHPSMESLYEYGSRVGVWRLLREFDRRELPLTCFAVAMAMERNPEPIAAMVEAGHEIASHGWRWIDYQFVDEATEREHIRKAVEVHTRIAGSRPLGFYQGRTSPQTRRLCVEEGGFLYDADSYADDLPYWDTEHERPHLVVPYTLDVNDMRFSSPAGFGTPSHFEAYLRDTFDQLYAEGAEQPRMMSVGLHCRLAGRPGRARALARFLDYVQSHQDVWVCRRVDIAEHWRANHPPSMGSSDSA
ncbi:MAG: allantoinase PuuE [Nannocystaceae bacterium]|nr:allantoinase PuuE [bacterium]